MAVSSFTECLNGPVGEQQNDHCQADQDENDYSSDILMKMKGGQQQLLNN